MRNKLLIGQLPNILSLSRIVLIVLIINCMFEDTVLGAIMALLLFVLGVLTDFLDGYIARKYDCVTGVGKILDATVDKVFFFSICIGLILLNVFSLPILAVFIGIQLIRDIWVTVLRRELSKINFYLGASQLGKVKTVFQFVFLFLGLCIVMVQHLVFSENVIDILRYIAYSVYILSVIFSLQSAWSYLIIFREKQHVLKS